MIITKEALKRLSEADLRTKVLIPLFERMGYHDVVHYHGGTLEQGKDIVMWREDGDLQVRRNYAVVAKADRITGQASGRGGSAAEVHMQIRQAFGSTFRDRAILKEHRVDRCLVVSSGEISKEARESLSAALASSNLDLVTEYIDGDQLWEWVARHMPGAALHEHISKVQDGLRGLSSTLDLTAAIGSNQVEWRVAAKLGEPAASLSFSGTLVLPNTDEGRELNAALENHLKTGAPVTIPKPQFRDLRTPDSLASLLQLTGIAELQEMRLGPRRAARPFLAQIVVHATDGESAALDAVPFQVVQVGTDEATIKSAA